MISKYIVSVHNDYNELMTFEFKQLHDALTLYRVSMRDETVSYISVVSVVCDDNDNDFFVDSETIRCYERGVDIVRD